LEEKDKLTEDDKKKIEEWMKKTMEEYQRGKKGLGTPAVIAAPAGTFQEPLSKIAKIFHKGVFTLTNAQGMVSVLVSLKPQEKTEGIIFHTAKSDAYQQPINVSQGRGSMGVVGINQSQSVDGQTEIFVTTRKTPSQAQREIKQWIDKNTNEKNRKKTYKIFDQVLKNWEELNKGKITLDKYEKDLEKLFQQLPEELKKRFSNKKGELQRQLNFLLQESAEKTVEADIKEAIKIIRLMLGFAVVKNDETPQDDKKNI
jgi:glutamyl/glutaminyl-tRNA synthetase